MVPDDRSTFSESRDAVDLVPLLPEVEGDGSSMELGVDELHVVVTVR